MVTTDNEFADWLSTAHKGAEVVYYRYSIESGNARGGSLLALARTKSGELDDLANKAWSAQDEGLVTLAQRRTADVCEYFARRR